MSDFAVFGVAGALAVKRIVDFLKKLGLPKSRALLAAFMVAFILLVANEAAGMSPEFLLWYERVWRVLFFGLCASELYDAQRSLANHS